MGRKANLPLFEIILLLLSKNPMISLEHVKAHGSKTKLAEWTRAQWGNLYADAIAKDQTDTFSKEHMEMSLIQMEKLIMSQNSWFWKTAAGHLALEPLRQLFQTQYHRQYMQGRDTYRGNRDEPMKWQYAKLGLLNPLWKTHTAP
jgi:hypothetical protein